MLIWKALPQLAIRRVVFTNGGPLPLAQVWAPAFPVLRPPGILVQPACFTVWHDAFPFWAGLNAFRSVCSSADFERQISGRFQRRTRCRATVSMVTDEPVWNWPR